MMPETVHTLPVTGTLATDAGGTMLVLSERLDGHDTFLTGRLVLNGAEPVSVRILTLDDVTLLRVLDDEPISITDVWSGVLHLPHGWRTRSLPADLIAAAANARRNIGSLDEAELHHVAAACRTSPANMVHIGDDWTCDVVGARTAGVTAIWISNGRAVPEPGRMDDPGLLVAADLAGASRQLADIARRRRP